MNFIHGRSEGLKGCKGRGLIHLTVGAEGFDGVRGRGGFLGGVGAIIVERHFLNSSNNLMAIIIIEAATTNATRGPCMLKRLYCFGRYSIFVVVMSLMCHVAMVVMSLFFGGRST